MVSQDKIQAAMQIILHAGDARVHCMNALDEITAHNFLQAKTEMELANEKIVNAHKVQTSAIQAETQGSPEEYSVLFAHAQDTLMTIYSEINLTKRLMELFQIYDQRLTALEEQTIEK
jgi:PTS system cellobiose-specific IIA component